jgi:hypothetical protein
MFNAVALKILVKVALIAVLNKQPILLYVARLYIRVKVL